MLSNRYRMPLLALAVSLSLVSACGTKGSQSPIFPPLADLQVEPKPTLAPEAVLSEAALDAHDIAIETRGDRLAAQVARLCRYFDRMGMPNLNCPAPEVRPPDPG